MTLLQDHFPFSIRDIQKTLHLALSRGGDFAEAYLEYTQAHSIQMEEDIVKDTTETISRGLGIRVLFGEQTGYGYSNALSSENIHDAALTAANIAKGNSPKKAKSPVPLNYSYDRYSFHQPAHEAALENKLPLVKRAYQAAEQHDPKIIKVKASLVDIIQHVTIINSEGLMISDKRPMVKLICMAIAEKAGIREAGFSGGGGRVGLEYFNLSLTPERIGKEAAQVAEKLLVAQPPPAGEMTVVLSPGHSGVFIHEAVGHLLEADFIRKKTSVFWNKLGKKVADEQVSIFDDPTIDRFRGSYNIDDEGTVPQKTILIKDGKLEGLLQDRLSAKLMGMTLTGHGRRQDYSCLPIPRMSNTYIEKGEYAPEEIIRSVNKGFYAHQFQGGQVEDSGKFTFTVSSGHLIEEGRLTAPVKQATLIGTNIDILNQIEMVGSDLQFGLQTGTCGKAGQEAPVTDGCPTIKISRMTVGGIK
jgi:TldD protein